jgi:uncharacterized membrane protein
MINLRKITVQKILPYLLIFLGLVGLLASFTLTVDKIHFLKDPSFSASCNINPIISCASIMSQPQSEFLGGVPNTLLGLIAFPVLITVGASMLFGAKFNKLFWKLFQLGALGGLFGIIYMFYQGTYVIGAVCLWCALTWATVIPINLYLLVYNWRVKNISVPGRLNKVNDFLQVNHFGVLVLTYLLILGLILNRFWYYFGA